MVIKICLLYTYDTTSSQALHVYESYDSSMKLPKTSVRTSVFLSAYPSVSDSNGTENFRRRVLSADAGPTDVLKDIRNRLITDPKGNVTLFDPWNPIGLRLSTQDKLISPRPLGPTHILVIVDASELTETASQKRTVRARSIQMPINDLLFN